MGLFKRLSGWFAAGGSDPMVLWIYARCGTCGEIIASRINLANDLSATDDGYLLHKELMGSQRRCYRRIEVEMTFDANRKVLSRDILGGVFVSKEEYAAQQGHQEG
jgi:hypothetical protein